ncbi:2-oxo acid dehydrogenase subunit E2 [Lutispora sp.]|uniref:2-oxo acid dehydrogenase subunit E2 n=1 Tax=Lutispora sp. TaxID=2828727 RepID=UPI00356980A5
MNIFTHRYDGRRLKTISPFVKIIPYIMTKRSDAHVFSKMTIVTDTINEYIKEKQKQGFKITYLHLFIAVFVRVIAQRPQLNRFIMNNRIYARNRIWISLSIKRTLKDYGEETTVKFTFTGHENIYEIAKIIDKNIAESIPVGTNNKVDKIADRIMSLPNIIVKLLVGLLKQMDKLNILPGSIIEASPFHTTLFFTYLKSIKLDYVYHHIYDFGNTGIFISLGKEKKIPVVEKDEIKIQKVCEIGAAIDERICDGLYFSNSLKLVKKYLENPYLLEANLEEVVQDVE